MIIVEKSLILVFATETQSHREHKLVKAASFLSLNHLCVSVPLWLFQFTLQPSNTIIVEESLILVFATETQSHREHKLVKAASFLSLNHLCVSVPLWLFQFTLQPRKL
jgi:hypothetical protein